jgi:hypothetical protein
VRPELTDSSIVVSPGRQTTAGPENTVETKGSLFDITAAAERVGPNDGLFAEGPSA